MNLLLGKFCNRSQLNNVKETIVYLLIKVREIRTLSEESLLIYIKMITKSKKMLNLNQKDHYGSSKMKRIGL